MKKVSLAILSLVFIFSISLPVTAASNFSDVKDYKGQIEFLTDKGIIKGYQDGTFRPENPIYRVQAVQMILRDKGIKDFSAPDPNFTDLQPGDDGYDEVAKAVELGFISGKTNEETGEKYFDTYGTLTRAQMAKVLVLAYNLEGNYDIDFSDVPQDDWAYDFIDTLAANDITTGYENGTFKPDSNLTRKHFAVFMSRLLGGPIGDNGELRPSENAELNSDKVVLIVGNNNQGNGVVMDNGLILTNYHIIDAMTSGTVILGDGTSYAIEGIVEANKEKDLALLKTTKKIEGIDPVTIGAYSKLKKRDKIVAIGSYKGFQNTFSDGMITSIESIDGTKFIESNASIDNRNSGGGLFNIKGELIGITAINVNENQVNTNYSIAMDEASSWEKYYSMDFNLIKTTPLQPTTPSEQYLPVSGLTNIALGMTPEEVKKANTTRLYFEDTNILMYENMSIIGSLADVSYEFENNHLVAINVFHYVADAADADVLENYFNKFSNEITQVYGEPVVVDDDWFDDDSGLQLSAFWVAKSNNLLMTVKIDDDYSTFGGFRISTH